jgi:hypothetical protein
MPSQRELPPEPWRKLGGEAVRRLVARKERAEERGRRPDRPTRAGAGLSWLTTPPPPWRRTASGPAPVPSIGADGPAPVGPSCSAPASAPASDARTPADIA